MRLRGMVCAIGLLAIVSDLGPRCAQAGEVWQSASPEHMGANPKPLEGLADAIHRGDFPKTTSVLVVFRNRLVYEQYFADGGAEVLNDTRSATKSITALAIGAAIRDRAISSARAPAFHYLEDLAPFQNDTKLKHKITIEDLLTMSSSLDCDDNVDASPGNEDRMHEQQHWARWAVDLPTMKDYQRDSEGRGPFSYCTAGAFLLGQILQRATNTPVDRYVERNILAPLGISKWEWPRSPSGEVMTGGGLRLRSRDLAKIAWLIVNDGRSHTFQVVPAAWVKAATTAHRNANVDHEYGYLFWQHTYKTKCGTTSGWYMSGNGGNAIVALKELEAAVVISRKNYNSRGMHQQTVDLLEKYVIPAVACLRS
jgi:CubicO group peptidase (beta-lactamase class C family)